MVWVMTTRTGLGSSPVAPRRTLRPQAGWFVRVAWAVHRAANVAIAGVLGPRRATAEHPVLRRLATGGRRTGQGRRAIPDYLEDGSDLLLVVRNGWADPTLRWLPDRHGYTLIAWR